METHEAELWAAYLQERDDESRNALVNFYWPLCKKVIGAVAGTLPSYLRLSNELDSDAFVGLINAIDKFDPCRGIKFMTFATIRIRGAMLDGLRERDWVPRLERLRISQGDTQQKSRMVSLEAINEKIAKMCNRSFDRKDPAAPDPASAEDIRDFWRIVLKGFNRIERLIVTLYFIEDLTMKQIGKQVGLSESRISQLMSALRPRIECQLNAEYPELTRFLKDE